MRKFLAWLLLLSSTFCFGQSPGLIVRPPGGNGVTVLNPDGNGYSSATTSGFTASDITQSEVLYKVVPPAITEPTGDLATGPSGGFTDIVKTLDGSGFYVFSDGTNMLFRLRIGNIISGSKGYSVLFDTDGKIGNTGPAADPNYVAPTNTSNGNSGFEYEVVLQTNFQVAVYAVDGSSNPGGPVSTYALSSNSQISVALTTDGNNPDYFYDWYVPLTAIGSPASFRMAATTVTSPSSALQGSRSDIYGIDDAGTSPSDAWTSLIKAQPTITLTDISSGGSGLQPVCTAAPTLNTPVNTGSNISITGSWSRMDASKPSSATITLYKNGVAAGTHAVSSGNTWNIVVPTVAAGDVFYAKAQASGETQCLQSATITAGCAVTPAAPTISCASTKGITGNIPLGTTISIYQVNTSNANPSTTSLTTGLTYTNNTTDQIFNYFGTNPQSGNACQGQNGILATNTTYMLVANNGGCLSAPTFICITGSSQGSWNYITTNSLSLTAPIYPYQTSITGSGAVSGQMLRLFINNKYVSAITASASTFTFSGLSLSAGDVLKIYVQSSGACMTVSPAFTVSCYTSPPTITTNAAGNLVTASTSISGYSSVPGATIQLYKGTAPSGTLAGTATVNSNGSWTVTGLTLTANDNYYANQTSGGCTSPNSSSATVLGLTSTCPAFGSVTYAENATSVSGTIASFSGTIRLYLDGTLIGSTVLSNATSWSIPVNTSYANTLYSNGVLTVTAQSASSAESTGCNATATVTCTPPASPSITPLNSTINTGQTVTFSVSNVTSNTWYAVMDNTGSSFATSLYTTNSNNFNLVTRSFNSAGTYQLRISADKLTGCSNNYQTATIVVNQASLPVNFLEVKAEKISGVPVITWLVDQETEVDHYEVERSSDGQVFTTIGRLPFKQTALATNRYSFNDQEIYNDKVVYYRIKQIDIDGAYVYSKIVSLNNKIEQQFKIHPNPSRGDFVLQINSPAAGAARLMMLNSRGQIFFMREVTLHAGSNRVNISLPHPSPGIYSFLLKGSMLTYSGQLVITCP